MLSVTPLDRKAHLPELTRWWLARGLPETPEEFLPPTGLVVLNDDKMICGGFLVKSDTGAAVVGSISADPDSDKDLRSEAIDKLILALVDVARECGFRAVCVSTNVKVLQARYERLGFTKTDENVTHYGGLL